MSKPWSRPSLGAALAVAVVAAMFATPALASSGRTTIAGAVPSWATGSNLVRPVSPAGRVSVDVVLGWRNLAALRELADAVSTPGSPSYHRFLSAAQVRARFAPTASNVRAVQDWVRSQGLRPGLSPKSNLWVTATGTVDQVERAFDVLLNLYRLGRDVRRAPDRAPSVPASIGRIVTTVTGLADVRAVPHGGGDAPPPPAFVVGKPCSAYWAELTADDKPPAYGKTQPVDVCGYSPQQMQAAYGVDQVIGDGIDGAGQAVAIVDAFNNPTAAKDLKTYSKSHELPAPDLEQHNVEPAPGNDQLKQGWYGEEALDLDAVHAMAPKATIVYEGAHSSSGGDLLNRISDVLDNDRANIITNSYGFAGEGLPPGQIDQDEAVYEQAVAQGVGIYFSSGDCGDNTDPDGLCANSSGKREPNYPASSPNVTSVGGTSLAVGKKDDYLFETGWGTGLSNLQGNNWVPAPPGGFLYGAGGGVSGLFDEPKYQKKVVPKSLAKGHRVVPDIGADGDPNTGFTIGITQTFHNGKVKYGEYRIGGTSLSSPLIAGIVALADQAAGSPHGFINPALYALAKSNPKAFNDIVDPKAMIAVVRTNYVNNENKKGGLAFSLRTMDQVLSLKTRKGYDACTGIGTPVAPVFVTGL